MLSELKYVTYNKWGNGKQFVLTVVRIKSVLVYGIWLYVHEEKLVSRLQADMRG